MTEFATKRLHFAIFLHASGLLRYLRTEPSADGKLRFVFRDEQRSGSKLELDFERGASVSARDLFSSQTFLRREMTEAENLKIGECTHAAHGKNS